MKKQCKKLAVYFMSGSLLVSTFTVVPGTPFSIEAEAHSGRTDANGGHKDNKIRVAWEVTITIAAAIRRTCIPTAYALISRGLPRRTSRHQSRRSRSRQHSRKRRQRLSRRPRRLPLAGIRTRAAGTTAKGRTSITKTAGRRLTASGITSTPTAI